MMKKTPPFRLRRPVKVFISYCHKNSRFKDELLDHMRLLERENLIVTWHDRGLLPDGEWERQLLAKLNKADIVLMLASSAFIASKYCYEVELPCALRRFGEKKCMSTWVLVHPCQWKRTPLAKLQSWPDHGKSLPVSKHKREEAWTRIADMIADYVERNTARRRRRAKVS